MGLPAWKCHMQSESSMCLNRSVWQASGFQRVRNRRVGASNRARDPLGAGLYIFSGVRWLDPDNPVDAHLLRSSFASLTHAFPHLAGVSLLDRLAAILRRNRSEWSQNAWGRTHRRHRHSLARGQRAALALPAVMLQPPPEQEDSDHCHSSDPCSPCEQPSSFLPACTGLAFFRQDSAASASDDSFQALSPPAATEPGPLPKADPDIARRHQKCPPMPFAIAPISAASVATVITSENVAAAANPLDRPARPPSPSTAPPSQRTFQRPGPWRTEYGDMAQEMGEDDSESRHAWPSPAGPSAVTVADACPSDDPLCPHDPAAAAGNDGNDGFFADGLAAAYGADRLELPPAGEPSAAWASLDWLLPDSDIP